MALGTRKIPDPMTEPTMSRTKSRRRTLSTRLVMYGRRTCRSAKDICNTLQAQPAVGNVGRVLHSERQSKWCLVYPSRVVGTRFDELQEHISGSICGAEAQLGQKRSYYSRHLCGRGCLHLRGRDWKRRQQQHRESAA